MIFAKLFYLYLDIVYYTTGKGLPSRLNCPAAGRINTGGDYFAGRKHRNTR
jgi:hypothetical protein